MVAKSVGLKKLLMSHPPLEERIATLRNASVKSGMTIRA